MSARVMGISLVQQSIFFYEFWYHVSDEQHLIYMMVLLQKLYQILHKKIDYIFRMIYIFKHNFLKHEFNDGIPTNKQHK